MKFKTKLKIKLWIYSVCSVLGLGYVIVALLTDFHFKSDTLSLLIGVVGVLGFASLNSIWADIDKCGGIDQYEVSELDERNVMLKTRASSITFFICLPALWIATYISAYVYRLGGTMGNNFNIFAWIAIAMTLIYEITYFILKRKY